MSEENKKYDGIDTLVIAEKCAKVAAFLVKREDTDNLADEVTYNKVKEIFTEKEMAFLATKYIVAVSVKQMAKDPVGFAMAMVGLQIREEKENG